MFDIFKKKIKELKIDDNIKNMIESFKNENINYQQIIYMIESLLKYYSEQGFEIQIENNEEDVLLSYSSFNEKKKYAYINLHVLEMSVFLHEFTHMIQSFYNYSIEKKSIFEKSKVETKFSKMLLDRFLKNKFFYDELTTLSILIADLRKKIFEYKPNEEGGITYFISKDAIPEWCILMQLEGLIDSITYGALSDKGCAMGTYIFSKYIDSTTGDTSKKILEKYNENGQLYYKGEFGHNIDYYEKRGTNFDEFIAYFFALEILGQKHEIFNEIFIRIKEILGNDIINYINNYLENMYFLNPNIYINEADNTSKENFRH